MSEAITNESLAGEVRALRSELNSVKEKLDQVFLSEEDEKDSIEAEKLHKTGKTVSLEEFKRG